MSTTLTLYPTKDTYAPGASWPDEYLSLSTFNSVLAQFDLSSIPAGSVILTATLGLYHFQYTYAQTGVYVAGITQTWAETTGTAPTYDATHYDSKDFGATVSDWHNWEIAGLVQRWVNGTLTNNGLIVKAASGNTIRFINREAGGGNIPHLIITYDPAPVNQNYAIMF